MKTMLYSLLAATSLTCLFAASSPAKAQSLPTSTSVSCSPFGSDGVWPAYAQTKQCVGAFTPAHTDLMRGMLEQISNSGTDAAALLQRMQLQTTDDIAITINDPSLTSSSLPVAGTATIKHQVMAGDNSYTVLADLVSQFIALNPNNYYAILSGNSIYLYAFDTGPISYSSAVLDDVSGRPVTETMTTSDNGDGTAVVTLGGTLAPYPAAWFDFGNWNDFVPSTNGPFFESNAADTQNSSAKTDGFSIRDNSTSKWSTSIFEVTSSGNTNPLISFTTAHETGHILDNLYGSNGETNDDFSDSDEFKSIVALDERLFNAQNKCSTVVKDAAGYTGSVGGAFSGLVDGNGNYYCDEDGTGVNFAGEAGGSNTDTMALTYPRYSHVPLYKNTSIPKYFSEIFSDSYAATLTTDEYDDQGNLLTGEVYVPILQTVYTCTSQYVQYLTHYGHGPSNSELAQWGGKITIGGGTAGSYTINYCDGHTEVVYWHFGS